MGKNPQRIPPPLSDKKGEDYAGLLPAKKPHISLKSYKTKLKLKNTTIKKFVQKVHYS
jgi:hypothetical protein